MKISEPVPSAAIHAQVITPPPPCFTDEVVCFGSWAFILCSCHHFDINSSSSHLSTIPFFQNCGLSFKYFLATEPVFAVNQWFAFSTAASIFLFMKSSADSGHWKIYTWLLKSVSDLSDRCLEIFLYYGENYSVISSSFLGLPLKFLWLVSSPEAIKHTWAITHVKPCVPNIMVPWNYVWLCINTAVISTWSNQNV